MSRFALLARKVAIAFAIGAGLAIVTRAGPAIDALEAQDFPEAYDAARVVAFGAVAGGLRGLISLVSAFVPSDADVGVNLLGAFKPGDPDA
jgi:hypothetical protein